VTLSDKQKELEAALDAFQVAEAASGSQVAFDLLYRRWHPRLFRLACRLTGNTEDARDVLQDAALTIARDLHKLRDPSKFSAWAYTIVRRRTADYIHKAVRQRDLSQETVDVVDVAEEALSLKQALSQLSETDHLMLVLFYQDGFRGIEIAAALGIPLGTVKSRLFKARDRLKSIYIETEGDER